MKDYYKILEVDSEASPEVITKAYRTLVQQYHPDRFHISNPTLAEDKIKDLNEAYEVLHDSAKRKEYDRKRLFPSPPVVRQRGVILIAAGILLFAFLVKFHSLLLMSFAGKAMLVVGVVCLALVMLRNRSR